MKCNKIVIFIQLMLYCSIGLSQEFEFFFDTDNTIDCQRVQEDENGDYVLVGNMYDTADHYSAYILKLNENFDTTFRMIENVGEDVLFQDFLVLPGNEYFVVGTKGSDIGSHSNVTHILVMMFNENLEILFEKKYALCDSCEYNAPDIKIMQNDDDKIYITAKFLEPYQYGDYNMLIQMNQSGDTIRTKGYQSNITTGLGEVDFIMNDNDNLPGFYGYSTSFSSFSPMEILEIDTNFNIDYFEVSNIGGNILQLSPRFTTKWLDNNNYLLLNSEKPDNSSTVDIFVAKFNTSHEIVGDPIWVGRPDTSDWVPRYGMDWTDPDNIFVCAYQFVYHVPWEVNQVVAIIDSDLNVKGMKYYGEDLNFGIWTLCATSDGGAILPIAHHDYNNPHIDADLIVWKISADDIITSAAETPNPYDSDYYVYPNPGNDVLNIQTAQKGVLMKIYDDNGNLVLKKKLMDFHLNQINTSLFVPGSYIYKITDSKGDTECGKWIKH